MLAIGKYQTLVILRQTDNGFYLTEKEGTPPLEEVLMPNKFITEEMEFGDEVEVFVYKDSEDRAVATTQKPLAIVGECAYLEVKEVAGPGAFLDWGLDKDLLLPFREQTNKVESGKRYLVYVYHDLASGRIAATTNLNKFIKNIDLDYNWNQEVDLIIADEIEAGIKVVINHKNWGILYKSEVFKPLRPGQQIKGYIKKIREDDKIDVSLQKQGLDASLDLKDQILQQLQNGNGFLPLCDTSPPHKVAELLGTSKKKFKEAIGMLFKEKKITILGNGIRLIREQRGD